MEIESGYHYYCKALDRIVFVSKVKDGVASYERPYVTEKGWIAHGNGRTSVDELTPLHPHVLNVPLEDDTR